jgi:NAD(P)-dependent dehydrogenase (short-subunit alcohol dehydrogenase family)
MSGSLEDKVILITGSGSGIGRATALACAREGAQVVVSDLNPEWCAETSEQVLASGGSAHPLPADVSDAAQVETLIRDTVQLHGRLDCAHNNAGIEGEQTPFHNYSEEMFDRVTAINLTGVWYCMKFEIQQMLRQGGGVIVNTSSGSGLTGTGNGVSAYNASKHGVMGLTRAAAMEYAREGIRVNAVCPGAIDTPMADRLLGRDPVKMAATATRTPSLRWGTAEEVAEVVVWMCSDATSYLTGQPVSVDGGSQAGR